MLWYKHPTFSLEKILNAKTVRNWNSGGIGKSSVTFSCKSTSINQESPLLLRSLDRAEVSVTMSSKF